MAQYARGKRRPHIWDDLPSLGCEKKREWLVKNKPFSKRALLWLYVAGGGDLQNQTATENYLTGMKDFMAVDNGKQLVAKSQY